MKKVLLTAMTILSVASASVFGMYGNGDSWIDFLVHGNQFRARMDQFGFTLGNGTIKGTLGFRANTGAMGSIISPEKTINGDRVASKLDATISAGIGYTSEAFGIGLGYNYTYVDNKMAVHTPVLAINALNNNLRIAAPIQVAVGSDIHKDGDRIDNYTGISFDNIQLRYYTGIDAFNAVRFYVYYRNTSGEGEFPRRTAEGTTTIKKSVSEALGFQLRLYFLNTTVGNASVNPYIRLEYHTALKGHTLKKYSAASMYNNEVAGLTDDEKQSDIYEVNPFEFSVKPTLALSANSDIVSLLFEPSLGYKVYSEKVKGEDQFTTHTLTWGAYTELYFTPVKDLEWYFEMDVNGNVTGNRITGGIANESLSPVLFETTTGLTWYLPSFQE